MAYYGTVYCWAIVHDVLNIKSRRIKQMCKHAMSEMTKNLADFNLAGFYH